MMEWTCKIGGMQSRDILVSSDSRHKISIQRQYTRLDEYKLTDLSNQKQGCET